MSNYSDEKNPYDDDNQCLEETISYCPCGYLRKAWKEGYLAAEKEHEKCLEYISKIRDMVKKQSEDYGLWCRPNTAPEDYIQRALRKLHGVIDGEDVFWIP